MLNYIIELGKTDPLRAVCFVACMLNSAYMLQEILIYFMDRIQEKKADEKQFDVHKQDEDD